MHTRRRNLAIPIIIVAAAALLIAYVVFGNDSEPTAELEETPNAGAVVNNVVEPGAPEEVDIERRDESDPLALGQVDAPVTIVMFSDFQCSFCALWTHETLPVINDYVDAGDVRIEWRDLAIFGDDSRRAAYAGYAAGLQGKYVEFSALMFDGGNIPDASQLSDAGLEQAADEIGLDVAQFNEDRQDQQVIDEVEKGFEEGEENGVFSTPSFLINGDPIVGAQPTETFREKIDEALEN